MLNVHLIHFKWIFDWYWKVSIPSDPIRFNSNNSAFRINKLHLHEVVHQNIYFGNKLWMNEVYVYVNHKVVSVKFDWSAAMGTFSTSLSPCVCFKSAIIIYANLFKTVISIENEICMMYSATHTHQSHMLIRLNIEKQTDT